MPSVSKFKKNNDGVASMFLVPKRLYESLLNLLKNEDEETKNEIIALNQNLINNNNNYIENAIKYRNLQNLQKNTQKKPDFTNSNITQGNLTATQDYQPMPMSSLLQQQTIDYSSPLSRLPMSETISSGPNVLEEEGAAAAAIDTSTPIRPPSSEMYRSSPILRAMNEPNKEGKRVCPFSKCKKQYVNEAELAKHIFSKHGQDLAVRDRQLLEYSLVSSQTPEENIQGEKLLRKTGKKTFDESSLETSDSPSKKKKPRTRADVKKATSKKMFPSSYPKLKR